MRSAWLFKWVDGSNEWVVVRLGGCEEGAAWVWVWIWVRSESESGEVEVEVEVQGLEVDVVLLVTWSTIFIGFLG